MGLTVHYKLTAPADCDAARALELVRLMRRRAQGFKYRGRVTTVNPIRTDPQALRRGTGYREVPHPWMDGRKSGIEFPPESGFLFYVHVGADCEPMALGLCCYPKTVLLEGKRHRTNRPAGASTVFPTTQLSQPARRHHFRRCHCAVVDLLHSVSHPGLVTTINDEGDYWPGGSLAALRQNLEEMNGVVASAAGALKDLDQTINGTGDVASPIFRHPHFERLEAEGEAKHATATGLRRVLPLQTLIAKERHGLRRQSGSGDGAFARARIQRVFKKPSPARKRRGASLPRSP